MKKIFTRRKFLATVSLAGLACAADTCWFEPCWLRIRRHKIKLTTSGKSSPLKILHLSDFHASPVVSISFIKKAIQSGLSLEPDLICLTGDFITRNYDQLDGYAQILSSLVKTAPTFACLGNHDGGKWAATHGGFEDTEFVQNLLKTAGITLLHNTAQIIQVRTWRLALVGLGDAWADEVRPEIAFIESPVNQVDATIVLSHNPDTKTQLQSYKWDLMLCGHTHGGQISLPLLGTPFAPVQDKNLIEGLYSWENRWIHITRGVGNVFGTRFNCRPEISILTLN